mmetsp:Transcript_10719/g.23114  ORF Transcript_10719/g.23114 Transcript_10719/m.23114 type:complete len:206 (+) Transcript_10719:504-1121(+)
MATTSLESKPTTSLESKPAHRSPCGFGSGNNSGGTLGSQCGISDGRTGSSRCGVPALLGEGLLEQRREVLCHLEGVDGDVDGGHALGRALAAGEHVLGRQLLERLVVVALQEEVGHHLGVGLGRLLDVLLQLLVGRLGAEDLLAVLAHNRDGVAAGVGAAAIDVEGDHIAVLGLDGEADLVEVGELLAGRTGQSQHLRELGVGLD